MNELIDYKKEEYHLKWRQKDDERLHKKMFASLREADQFLKNNMGIMTEHCLRRKLTQVTNTIITCSDACMF